MCRSQREAPGRARDTARRWRPRPVDPRGHTVSPPRQGWLAVAASLALLPLATGCSMAPKSFRKINDPAAITRARSVSLGQNLPQWRVVPSLIDRLEDPDR